MTILFGIIVIIAFLWINYDDFDLPLDAFHRYFCIIYMIILFFIPYIIYKIVLFSHLVKGKILNWQIIVILSYFLLTI